MGTDAFRESFGGAAAVNCYSEHPVPNSLEQNQLIYWCMHKGYTRIIFCLVQM